MAKISIIVPVYNVEAYIEECLNSLIWQTFHDIEIICVDDCSTDASMDIVQRFAENDARIRIVRHSENQGLATSRNTGLDVATASYVMCCDSDDFFAPDMCKKMYVAMQNAECDMAVCGVRMAYEANEDWRGPDEEYYRLKFEGKQIITKDVLMNTDVSVCNKIFKKVFIDQYKIRFPDGLKYEDAFFFNAYAAVASTAFFLNEKLYNYRRRHGSIMDTTFNKQTSDSIHHLEIAIKLCEFYRKWGLLEAQYKFFTEFFVRMYDCAVQYGSSEGEQKDIEKLAISFARFDLEDVSILPECLRKKQRLKWIVQRWIATRWEKGNEQK